MQENDPLNLQEPINPDQQGFDTEDYLSQQNQTVSDGELNEGLGQEYIQPASGIGTQPHKPGNVSVNPANQPRRFGLFGARKTSDKADAQKPDSKSKDEKVEGPKTDLPGAKSATQDKKKEEKEGGSAVGAAGRTAAEMKKIAATSGGNGWVAAGQYLNKLRTSSQFRKDQLKTMGTVRKVQLVLLCLALVIPLFVGMLFFGLGGVSGDNVGRLADTTGTVGTASGDGTFNAGGIFTCELRSFLDTIASHETGETMTREHYGWSQNGHKQFDALDPKWDTAFPPGESSGRNIGRYQIDPDPGKDGDIQDAQAGLDKAKIPFKITGYSAKQQDYVALGRWYFGTYRKTRGGVNMRTNYGQYASPEYPQKLLENGEEGFKTAVVIASTDFASTPVVIPAIHADPGQSHVTFEAYFAFYQKRLQYCGTQSQGGAVSKPGTTILADVAGAHRIPNVPGVQQADKSKSTRPDKTAGGGQCGTASTLMVTLFYKPSFTDGAKLDTGNTAGSSRLSVKPYQFIPNLINYLNEKSGVTWTMIEQKQKTKAELLSIMTKSIDGGDPMIVYTGAIIYPMAHIYVVMGYDATSFYVNNPHPGGVDMATNKAHNGAAPTIDTVLSAGAKDANPVEYAKYNYRNAEHGSHNNNFLIVRSKYVK